MKNVNARQPLGSHPCTVRMLIRAHANHKKPQYSIFWVICETLLLLDTSRTSSFSPHGIMDVVHNKDSICYKISLHLQLVTRMKIEWSSGGGVWWLLRI
jgi:hypothetical protein